MLDHRLRILEFTLKTVDSHGTLVFGGGEHQDEVWSLELQDSVGGRQWVEEPEMRLMDNF